jgi:hypothetical protein
MKLFNKITAFLSVAVFFLSACSGDLTRIGTSVLPPEDIVSVSTDTFKMTAKTIKLDSVYAKTTQCLLGQMYDPQYGNIKSDFLCQFYCEENFKFYHTPYEGKIDSMELVILYPGSSWFGDSIIPMQASVYGVNKSLQRNFYTNDNLELYCDMSNPLGRKTYTAYDLDVYDTLPALGTSYTHNIRIKLPVELGQKFYDETVNNPSTFSSQESFNKFFPGLYITTTFGSGNLIKTESENIFLRIFYSYMSQSTSGGDSIINYAELFTNSKEVIQISKIDNGNIESLLVPNSTYTYIKSPAGVCTQLTIPTTEIAKKIDVKARYINNFAINLHYLPTDEWTFAYAPPQYLLLIPKDSVKSFFEGGKIEDNRNYYISFGLTASGTVATNSFYSQYGYVASQRTYYFGNISLLLTNHIEKSPDKDLEVLILPVIRTFTPQSSVYYTTDVMNSLVPSGVKIRIDEDYMKVAVVSSLLGH